jgi:hypothetical protein
MNPGDRAILELNELCGALLDGSATAAQRQRLEQLLRESEAARRHYVRLLSQSASLQAYAAEMHVDAPARPVRRAAVFHLPRWAPLTLLAAAAALAVGVFVLQRAPRENRGPSAGARTEYVARLTGAKDAQWARGTTPLAPGESLRKGQRVELETGYAEITFDSGARIVLEGATSLDIASAWDATLRRGTLKADVPPQAIGFRVANRFVEVIDLGTEFTIIADSDRGAEVLVNKGEVEAVPRTGGDNETLLLREKEARRFADTGVSDVAETARKFALFDAPLSLERFVTGTRFAHWSFDETQGPARGDGSLIAGIETPLQLLGGAAMDDATSRSAGRRERALRFDGQRYANARVPGLSGTAPRTVAFWVRVPPDAQPLDTWMVAWGTQLPKLGRRPVHIGWNRRPSEGALGALRTDFGGGHAIGTTNLRDGNWHHIVVFFAPGEDAGSPVQVKQYVDGRLESSTIVRGTLSSREGTGDAALADTVWLGYRLTGNRQEGRRFRGELDELFIVDRALQPHEVIGLLKDNRLPDPTLAAQP